MASLPLPSARRGGGFIDISHRIIDLNVLHKKDKGWALKLSKFRGMSSKMLQIGTNVGKRRELL